jgi:hypothetical protein
MGRGRWTDFTSDGYQFKIIDSNSTEIYCKFRVTSEAARQKIMVVGTIFNFDDGRKAQVSSCQFNGDNLYGIKLTGSCVFQWLGGLPLYGTPVFYS